MIGAGPAGLFAALQLIELGLKPIVIERGKDVRGRRRDLKAINQDGKSTQNRTIVLAKAAPEPILMANCTRVQKSAAM